MTTGHTWKFFRAGGFDQVRLDTGADIAALDQLDLKLWVALSCPTRGLEFDTRTLDLIDTDHDGRIRAAEIMAAAKWTCACLRNPDDLVRHAATLPLSAIQDATPEGRRLLDTARQVLQCLGKPDATVIAVEDTVGTATLFAQNRFNGDGIVPAETAGDDGTRAVLADIMACVGAETDRSGKPGVNRAKADQFFAAARDYVAWWQQTAGNAGILPLGALTPAAAAAVVAVKAKVDDYFARCRLAAYDPRALTALNREEKDYLALTARDLTGTATEVAGFPLARIDAGRPLPLQEALNPAWRAAMARFRTDAVQPLLGEREVLSEADWDAIQGKLAAHDAWAATKAGGVVEKLGLQRVQELLAGGAAEAVAALIAQDQASEAEADAIEAVERLVRFHRDLHKLLLNFVNFRDFYGRKEKAIFQAGRLYLDQRSCDLCLTVEDAGKHAAMATLAGACLIYCDCVRKGVAIRKQIVAAFTEGDSDNLMVGRNGIFYDRDGKDWDATITKIVNNPISIRQAFWSPYKKLVRLIEEQVAKRASAAEARAHAQLEQADDKAHPAAPRSFDVGTIAALGVGLGALATVFGGFVSGFLKLLWWQTPLALSGVMVGISTPAVIMAMLKLHRRNLGPILDANGWAINAKALVNIPFGRSLTAMAVLPPGARRGLTDPYAEKKHGRMIVLLLVFGVVLLGVLWRYGVFNAFLASLLPPQRKP